MEVLVLFGLCFVDAFVCHISGPTSASSSSTTSFHDAARGAADIVLSLWISYHLPGAIIKAVPSSECSYYSYRFLRCFYSRVLESCAKVGFAGRVSIEPEELQRFSSYQAQNTGQTMARRPSRTAGAA
ncbi:hypothetical protein VKT23_014003 [Stygiomarasmius scandens]|uniref:Secreted protein n=1 Tax=Marasmiellus scandens TaxID=2682957 RepID=A0ABR1J530_9AGAR